MEDNQTEIKKSVIIFDDDTCADWVNEEVYRECTDLEPDEEIDSDSYWSWVSDCIHSAWEDFKAAIRKHLDGNLCVITGNLGLWNGNPEIMPEICSNTLEALERCFDIRGDHFETVAIEEDGSLSVNVHHHDGCNCFTLRKVAKESEGLALYIQDYGEDEESKFSDIKFEKYNHEDFEL